MNTSQDDAAWASALAATIRAESTKLGMKPADMVKATGIPSTTYWWIQREGGRSPNPIQLRRISCALGISVGELFTRADALAAEIPARKTNAQKAAEYHERMHPAMKPPTPPQPNAEADQAGA